MPRALPPTPRLAPQAALWLLPRNQTPRTQPSPALPLQRLPHSCPSGTGPAPRQPAPPWAPADGSADLCYSPPIEKVIKNNLGITRLVGLQPSARTETVTETRLRRMEGVGRARLGATWAMGAAPLRARPPPLLLRAPRCTPGRPCRGAALPRTPLPCRSGGSPSAHLPGRAQCPRRTPLPTPAALGGSRGVAGRGRLRIAGGLRGGERSWRWSSTAGAPPGPAFCSGVWPRCAERRDWNEPGARAGGSLR